MFAQAAQERRFAAFDQDQIKRIVHNLFHTCGQIGNSSQIAARA